MFIKTLLQEAAAIHHISYYQVAIWSFASSSVVRRIMFPLCLTQTSNASIIFAIVKSSLTVDCNKQISCKILVMFGLIYGWILLLVMDIISLLTIIYIVTTNWFVLFMVSKEFYFMHYYTIFNSKSSFLTNIIIKWMPLWSSKIHC